MFHQDGSVTREVRPLYEVLVVPRQGPLTPGQRIQLIALVGPPRVPPRKVDDHYALRKLESGELVYVWLREVT